jgi:hypothetical protein
MYNLKHLFGKGFWALHTFSKVAEHLLLAGYDTLVCRFAPTLHIWKPSLIQKWEPKNIYKNLVGNLLESSQ